MAGDPWRLEGYSYLERGRRVGPISLEEIEALFAAGVLRSSDTIWTVWMDGNQKRLVEFLIREALPIA